MNAGRAVLAALLICAGCTRPQTAAPDAATPGTGVYTTFYPTTFLAREIGGEAVPVTCILPATADPATWRPPRDIVRQLQSATVILLNGAGFEPWTNTISLPRARVVDTSATLDGSLINTQRVTHSHGFGGAHTHGGLDGHIWLDPHNTIAQARAIAAALSQAFPEQADTHRARLTAVIARLKALDAAFRALTPHLTDVQLSCAHPAYRYPARRYGWTVAEVDLDPEGPLDAGRRAALAELLKTPARIRILLWESPPTDGLAASLKTEFDLRSVVFSPCEKPPADGLDYVAAMHRNLADLQKRSAVVRFHNLNRATNQLLEHFGMHLHRRVQVHTRQRQPILGVCRLLHHGGLVRS